MVVFCYHVLSWMILSVRPYICWISQRGHSGNSSAVSLLIGGRHCQRLFFFVFFSVERPLTISVKKISMLDFNQKSLPTITKTDGHPLHFFLASFDSLSPLLFCFFLSVPLGGRSRDPMHRNMEFVHLPQHLCCTPTHRTPGDHRLAPWKLPKDGHASSHRTRRSTGAIPTTRSCDLE